MTGNLYFWQSIFFTQTMVHVPSDNFVEIFLWHMRSKIDSYVPSAFFEDNFKVKTYASFILCFNDHNLILRSTIQKFNCMLLKLICCLTFPWLVLLSELYEFSSWRFWVGTIKWFHLVKNMLNQMFCQLF